jgi:hypothetical protein
VTPGLQALAIVAPLGLGACVGSVAAIAPPLVPGVVIVPDGVAIGTAHPVKLFEGDPEGRWIALCQARADTDDDGQITVQNEYPRMRGDTMKPYLVFGLGPGVEVDDIIGVDRTGEFIVFISGGRLLVHHVSAGRTEALAHGRADVTDDADVHAEHRAVTLDRARQRLAYHVPRRRGRGADVIVRDLPTGDEVVFRVPELLERAGFSASGDWLLLNVVTEDTNGDGRLGLSAWTDPPGPRACWGTQGIHHAHADERGDKPELHVAPITGGRPRKIPGLIFPVGDQLLIREWNGAIVAERADGRRTEWAPAACEGRIIGHSAAMQRVLVACMHGDRTVPAPIEIHGPGVHQALGGMIGPAALSMDLDIDLERFTYYEAVGGVRIVDILGAQEWRVPEGQRVSGVNAKGVVLEEGEGSTQWNLPSGTMELPESSGVRLAGALFETRNGRRLGVAGSAGASVELRPAASPIGPLVWRMIGR